MRKQPDSGHPFAKHGVATSTPRRLLGLRGTASYLGVSVWTVRTLEEQGLLRRVRVPLAEHGELRKLLYDIHDLDDLIARWKDA